ncbi:hypothetical protein D9611_006128 [Ephemerocybe angulata]|uniref:Transposase domain-containing protein n=1 Tax=Ephemerocybe angulata TaxID=980116 RepID=A0A8H5FLH2_9AGAR|nr:hypothetical protein D9611_006128 [Tulosesus angulatus]
MPKDTSKAPKSTPSTPADDVPHPCRCGCGSMVPTEIAPRTERAHLTSQPKSVKKKLEIEDLGTHHFVHHLVATAAEFGFPMKWEDPRATPPITSAGPTPVAPDVEASQFMDSNDSVMDVDAAEPEGIARHVESDVEEEKGGNGKNAVEDILKGWKDAHSATSKRSAWVEDVDEDEEDNEAAKGYGGAEGGFDYDREDEYNLNMGDFDDELEEQMEKMFAEFSAYFDSILYAPLTSLDAPAQELDDEDMDILRAYNLKLTDNLTDATFRHLPQAFPNHKFASLKATRKRVEFLARFRPVPYDCCINSCMCYAGPNAKEKECRYCDQPRWNASGKPRKQFNYIPLITRLAALFRNKESAKNMAYRHNYRTSPDILRDIFDGKVFEALRATKVQVGGHEQEYKFFDMATDIALGFASDGFAPFKSRKQTCWPLLVFNYNLSPELRFRFENLICVGVIPGPRKPKDFDSFLWPFVEELLELALGVKTYHGVEEKFFQMHAYLILCTGDMPAVAMMMMMKGHSSVYPCRQCKIRGILKPGTTQYYYPLEPPDDLVVPPDAPHPISYD